MDLYTGKDNRLVACSAPVSRSLSVRETNRFTFPTSGFVCLQTASV